MRQVYSLRKLSGGRCQVVLDDGTSFPLYVKETEQFGIREESFLEEAALRQIMGELLPKRAKMCAMHYLQKMDRTECQLRRKLEGLSYPEEIIDDAVSYVKGYHYIDDMRYALHYMDARKDSKSIRLMEQELAGKGISKEDIEKAAQQIEFPDEEGQIRYWLEKKHYRGGEADQKERERMYRFLLRKGYSAASIRNAILYE